MAALKGAFQRKLPHYCCSFSPAGFPTANTAAYKRDLPKPAQRFLQMQV